MSNLLDFDSHLMETIRDPHEAAYFLAACLEDAIAEGDDNHFFGAVVKVSKATGKNFVDCIRLLHSHIAPADFPNVGENMSIMMVKLVGQVDSLKDRFQEA